MWNEHPRSPGFLFRHLHIEDPDSVLKKTGYNNLMDEALEKLGILNYFDYAFPMITEYNEIIKETYGRYHLYICQHITNKEYKYISNAPFFHAVLLKEGIPFAFSCGAIHDKEGNRFPSNPIDEMRERAKELHKLDQNPFFTIK